MNLSKTILNSTLKHDLCINCGICKVACKFDAISMECNKYGEVNPVIDKTKCKNCGACVRFCPNTKEKLQKDAKILKGLEFPHRRGLEDASYYLAWDEDREQRLKCCSGGAVTKLATYLFEAGKIDGMIHVERLWGNRGDLHYGARLSHSVEEMRENVSSAYQPINFSEVLYKLIRGRIYFLTGTPCIIRGIKHLINNNKDFDEVKIMTCALVCSHNTSAQFIDFLTEINELPDNQKWQANIRHKDENIVDANNFKNHIYTKDGDLLNKNRFESGWTHIWRSYYFSMGACLKCTDFWGYEADISVKDAWGEWSKEPLGTSIVVVRNKELEKAFLQSGVFWEKLDYEVMKDHQLPTPVFKQTQAYNKNFKSILSRSNRKNGLLKYFVISKMSKFWYTNCGYKITKLVMKVVEKVVSWSEKL